MGLSLRPLAESGFGAVVDADLAIHAESLAPQLAAALHQHRLLIVPRQHLTHADMLSAASCFGTVDTSVDRRYAVGGFPGLTVISNIVEDGKHIGIYDGDNEEEWHADNSFKPQLTSATMLYSVITPARGGETRFADATRAYADLPPAVRQRIEAMRAVHSIEQLGALQSQASGGQSSIAAGSLAASPEVVHPLVLTHPATGARSLLLGSMVISRITTLAEQESRTLLEELLEHTTSAPYVYSHRCVYCFARKTHSYLDLDTGLGFDSQIVVKVNAPELLRRQLASRRWQGEHIAMGTNVDCYQRAEGRYRLMPGILSALRDHANPFSILTKGTLILRDLDLLKQASQVTEVGISVSVGFLDPGLWRTVEPGTPAPERRLDVVRTLGEHGIGCGVLMAPVIPFLSDHPAQLRATVQAIAASGATSVTPLVLHLRPGAREWFMAWLERHHPYLVRRYERLYADGAYAPKWYQRRITRQVHQLAEEYGIGPTRAGMPRRIRQPGTSEATDLIGAVEATEPTRSDGPALSEPTQLTLI